ncbi:MAG: hypothetical protein ACTHNT_13975 [Actinomycetales bacterium]
MERTTRRRPGAVGVHVPERRRRRFLAVVRLAVVRLCAGVIGTNLLRAGVLRFIAFRADVRGRE